ncbi:hypothetical protein LPTSP4_10190 [Leptospira ryugenii]|uniref:6-hydroxymethylpterin diphosphokinase MptE-like domain-containing protein n=1 Tax=Leptospira ryugenii TaxID=1917863 RepID=A0A2P2DXZ2_9LEPT|nr:6-hydroxymethylpterin diphosphokinase MptE-like protein [Leptospira ryugenii]GBF49505.1 hypothetical protein LPTSP4_10190 [Leptospira ryugenii]
MSQMNDSLSSKIFERKPYLRNYFQSFPSENKWDIISTKSGQAHYVTLNGQALASTYSPEVQAKRLLESHNIKSTDVVLLLGLGNPELLKQVNERVAPGQIIVMLGDDPSLVPKIWEPVLAKILDVPGRHLFSGEAFFPLGLNYLESLPIERVSGLKVIRNQADLQRTHFFSDAEQRIQQVFSAKMSDLLTKFEFERLWIKNSIWNLLQVSQTPPYRFPISGLRESFSGLSALLVSAGPSLRKNLSLIQEIRDKVFILSCDTSLKVLLKASIIPDAVVTLDAQTNSFFHFMGESLEKIPLFADLVSSPTLLREPIFRSVVHSVTAKFQVDAEGTLVREVTAGGELAGDIFQDLGDIQSGGSVATTAFDMLRVMGFKQVFFIGQDLAYSGREIHSTGTHHNEKWLGLVNRKQSLESINEVIIRKRETKKVPACNGQTVLTDYVLELYRHWFEESAKTVNIPLINLNEEGAYIQGFQNVNPKEVTEILKEERKHDYPWHQYDPWKALTSKPKENNSLQKKSEGLFHKIQTDLLFTEKKIKEWESFDLNQIDLQSSELWLWLQEQTYLRRTVRKSEIYLQRHRDLDQARKNSILIQSLKKEIHYLKRSIYPIKELL